MLILMTPGLNRVPSRAGDHEAHLLPVPSSSVFVIAAIALFPPRLGVGPLAHTMPVLVLVLGVTVSFPSVAHAYEAGVVIAAGSSASPRHGNSLPPGCEGRSRSHQALIGSVKPSPREADGGPTRLSSTAVMTLAVDKANLAGPRSAACQRDSVKGQRGPGSALSGPYGNQATCQWLHQCLDAVDEARKAGASATGQSQACLQAGEPIQAPPGIMRAYALTVCTFRLLQEALGSCSWGAPAVA